MRKQEALDAVLGMESTAIVGGTVAKTKRSIKKADAPMQVCLFCTESVPAQAIRCRYCGSALREALPVQIELTAKRYKSMMVVGKLMLYIGIGLGIWGFNNYLKSHSLMSLLFPVSHVTPASRGAQYAAMFNPSQTRTEPQIAPQVSAFQITDVFDDEPTLKLALALALSGVVIYRFGRGLAWWNNG